MVYVNYNFNTKRKCHTSQQVQSGSLSHAFIKMLTHRMVYITLELQHDTKLTEVDEEASISKSLVLRQRHDA